MRVILGCIAAVLLFTGTTAASTDVTDLLLSPTP